MTSRASAVCGKASFSSTRAAMQPEEEGSASIMRAGVSGVQEREISEKSTWEKRPLSEAGETVAAATLNAYRPPDMEQFMKEQTKT